MLVAAVDDVFEGAELADAVAWDVVVGLRPPVEITTGTGEVAMAN